MFKVGDEVLIINEYQSRGLTGRKAHIVVSDFNGVYGLKVDGWAGHTLGGLVDYGGWWMPSCCFNKVNRFKGNK